MDKNRFKRCSLLMLIPFFCGISSFAQTLTGKVTDIKNEPLPGVTIMLKGETAVGTITDIDGIYNLKINDPETDVIIATFIGMESQEIAVKGRTTINIVMKDATTQLDEVVAVGYGTVKKRDITGSVSSVKGAALEAIPVASAAEAMAGQMAGIQITTTEGSPDADVNIRIRGGGSITQDNSPMYIVDGFPVNSISDIPASEIQSIDVLKDASSTAIYGARGANGVVIITTKSGKEGKVSVSYNAYTGIKKIANKLDQITVQDYVDWQYELTNLVDGPDKLDKYEDYFGNYADRDLYAGIKGNDWMDQVYGRTGTSFSHDLSVRGGSEKFAYNFSYAGLNTKEIMLGSGFSRTNLALKLDHKPNDKIKLSYSVRYSDTKIEGGGAIEQASSTPTDARVKNCMLYSPIPLNGIEDYDDEEFSSSMIPPLTSVADNDQTQYRKTLNLAGSFSWEIYNGLTLKTELGLQTYNYDRNRFRGSSTYWVKNYPSADDQGLPASEMTERNRRTIRNTNTLNYDFKDLLSNDDHSFKLLLGEETINTTSDEQVDILTGFPSSFDSKDVINLASQGNPMSVDNKVSADDKLVSFFGRVNYDYKGKYLLSATYRADGSSKFAKGNRWGYFPSAAVAWRIIEEDFMNGLSATFSNLKLRFSYGTAGNNNIPSGQLVQNFASNSTTYINNVSSYWAVSNQMANPDLKWETTVTRNIGLDYGLFNNKLSGSVEVYYNTTTDLLINFPVAGTGYDTQYRNMGETENKGLEFSVNWVAIDKPKYGLSLGFNISMNRNEITSLGIMEDFGSASSWASTQIGNDYWVSKGGSVGEIKGYLSAGRYEVSDFQGYDAEAEEWVLNSDVVDANEVIGKLRPGSMKIKNTNDDNVIDASDMKIIGNVNPLGTGGFNIAGRAYGFDLSAVFSYSYGNDVYNANKIEYTTSTNNYRYRNMITEMEKGKRWTNIDDNGQLVNDPAQLEAMNENTTMWSPYMQRMVLTDWAIEDASFLRLNTLTLGYTVPKSITNKVHINNVRLYATCSNVFVLTNYSGFDPEVSTRRSTPLTPGVDYSPYPKSRQFIFGLNLNF